MPGAAGAPRPGDARRQTPPLLVLVLVVLVLVLVLLLLVLLLLCSSLRRPDLPRQPACQLVWLP